MKNKLSKFRRGILLLLPLVGISACNTLNEQNLTIRPLESMPTQTMVESKISVESAAVVTIESLSVKESAIMGLDSASSPLVAKESSESLPEVYQPVNNESAGFILPHQRIIAYYGNPLSKRMGVLGEYDRHTMIAKLNREVKAWTKADPATPAVPALHLIAVVAQGEPGKAGKYRMIMPDEQVNKVYQWAKDDHAYFFIDIQTGHDSIRNLLPKFEWILKNPDVFVGIDPEFNLISSKALPGTRIGTYDASEINYVSGYLQNLVQKYNLPPKVLVVHRFTQRGVTNAKKIILRPDVQIVMNMDGWGPPILKRGTYRNFIVPEPVQYTGFKLFYHNDTKAGDPLMTPADVLKLKPQPVYIQYQ